MNVITQQIKDAKVKKDINEMNTELKRILNLLRNDNVPIELIKMRNTKNYFRKEKLPYLTTTDKSKSNCSSNNNFMKRNSLLQTFQLNNDNFTNNKKSYIKKHLSISESIGYCKGNVCLYVNDNSNEVEQSDKMKRISSLSPEIFVKRKKSFRNIPLMIKKQKRNFKYMKGYILEDPNVVQKYYEKKGFEFQIQNSLNCKCISPSMKHNEINIGNSDVNKDEFCPWKTLNHFKVQNFHLKKSLFLHNNMKRDNNSFRSKGASLPKFSCCTSSINVVQI